MKTVAIKITNRIFSELIYKTVNDSTEFNSIIIHAESAEDIIVELNAVNIDIALIEMTYYSKSTIESLVAQTERMKPAKKIILLVDEIAYPELAEDIVRSKQAGIIDAFLYMSVTLDYLMAVLESI